MKATLIIDMPESCCDCPLADDNMDCIIAGWDVSNNNCRPACCPLKELPEYIKGNPRKDYNKMYKAGYNACLDNILDK